MSEAPVRDLDLRQVGYCLIEAIAKSALFGHTTPNATMRDYGQHDGVMGAEYRFVRDALTLETAQLAETWWGGEGEAAQHAQETVQRALHPDEHPAMPTLADLFVDAARGVSSTVTHEGRPIARVVPYEESA